ncbi:hypothetical protein DRO56_00640 [Candidatus Bathyarchaeota archaeon]|nr:MAG: hypothetical protein DRO56_00640 [Candidatus Bathyarchaeota archaeon]
MVLRGDVHLGDFPRVQILNAHPQYLLGELLD